MTSESIPTKIQQQIKGVFLGGGEGRIRGEGGTYSGGQGRIRGGRQGRIRRGQGRILDLKLKLL